MISLKTIQATFLTGYESLTLFDSTLFFALSVMVPTTFIITKVVKKRKKHFMIGGLFTIVIFGMTILANGYESNMRVVKKEKLAITETLECTWTPKSVRKDGGKGILDCGKKGEIIDYRTFLSTVHDRKHYVICTYEAEKFKSCERDFWFESQK